MMLGTLHPGGSQYVVVKARKKFAAVVSRENLEPTIYAGRPHDHSLYVYIDWRVKRPVINRPLWTPN